MSSDAEITLPGSAGEHLLQQQFGSTDRARGFYARQVLDHLNEHMQRFVQRQEMVFVATSDGRGECDCSFRAGEPGFVQVLDERTLVYPEYRGNGVYASLGNVRENAHIGLLFVDFFRDVIGLHVNGAAQLIEHDQLLADARATVRILRELEQTGGRRPERWVQVSVHEAYVHCSKHIPLLAKLDKRIHWGTDDFKRKGGDFFGVARDRAAAQGRESAAAPACEGAAARALDLPAQRSSSKVHETTSSGP
jgi:predicted pyridoxine 5'-phosphate oxidase superfamily flavin-nucleotide-binding protein